MRAEASLMRAGLVAVAAVTVVGLMLGVLAAVPAPNTTGIGPAPTSGYLNLGDGAVTLSRWQNVTAQAYWYGYCDSLASASACTVPAGVVYVPPAHSIVLTQDRSRVGGFPGGIDAVTVLNSDTLQSEVTEKLNCSPEVPFYPGFGHDVFVPCLNTTSSGGSSVVVVNAESGTVSGHLSIPAPLIYVTRAYDSSDGIIYVVTGPDTLTKIDPANDTVAGILPVPGASWEFSDHPYAILFDPSTGDLLVPASGGGILSVNPDTGANRTIPFPDAPVAFAMDDGGHQLLATSFDPSSVFVYNASTYRLVAHLSIPNCLANGCAEPNDVNQVLLDPAHGDAYLLSVVSLITLNLSTLSLISWTWDYGNGPSWSATYVPSSDRIFGTYTPLQVQPGFEIQLEHGSRVALTRLLWLPVGLGILAVAVISGSTLVLARLRVARRSAS